MKHSIAMFRARRRARELIAYGALDLFPGGDAGERITRAIEATGARSRGADELLREPGERAGFGDGGRSAPGARDDWGQLMPLCFGHRLTGKSQHLDVAVSYACDWIGTHAPRPDNTSKKVAAGTELAVAMRLYRLAYILDAAARDGAINDARVRVLRAALVRATGAFENSEFCEARAQSGLVLALAAMEAARRFAGEPDFPAETLGRQGRALFDRAVEQQFSGEAVHLGHSPGHFLEALTCLRNAAIAGLVTDAATLALIDRAEEAFSWFVQPNGDLAAIGDTDRQALRPLGHVLGAFQNQRLCEILLTGNAEAGQPLWRAFPQAGYFCVQARAPSPPGVKLKRPGSTMLVQQAGFHSPVHKHADHLSLIWHEYGRDILVDPGHPGGASEQADPMRPDPERAYAGSTRAHNGIEVDGQEFPLRRVRPFGSALRRSGQTNGLLYAETECTHFRTLRHSRLVVLRPAHYLMIFDWLQERDTTSHQVRQWLHFSPDAQALRTAAGNGFVSWLDRTPTLSVLPLLDGMQLEVPVSGVSEPRLQGWHCDSGGRLVPAPAMATGGPAGRTVTLATVLTFGREARPDPARSNVAPSGRALRLVWMEGSRALALTIRRPMDGQITLEAHN